MCVLFFFTVKTSERNRNQAIMRLFAVFSFESQPTLALFQNAKDRCALVMSGARLFYSFITL